MIEILPETQEEYQELKELFKARPDVRIFMPQDCVTAVIWSIEDVKAQRPDASDVEAKDLLRDIYQQMVEDGNEMIGFYSK